MGSLSLKLRVGPWQQSKTVKTQQMGILKGNLHICNRKESNFIPTGFLDKKHTLLTNILHSKDSPIKYFPTSIIENKLTKTCTRILNMHLELSFLTVLALPNASSNGFDCKSQTSFVSQNHIRIKKDKTKQNDTYKITY